MRYNYLSGFIALAAAAAVLHVIALEFRLCRSRHHLKADRGTINPSEDPATALTMPTTRRLPSASV